MISLNDAWRYGPLFLLALMAAVSVGVMEISVGLMTLVALVVLVQKNEPVCWPQKSVILALGVLMGSYFLATLLSMPYPHQWYKFVEEMWLKLLLISVPIIIGRDPKKLAWAVKLILLTGGVAAAFAIVQHFLGVDPIRGRSLFRPQFGHIAVTGFFSHHLSFAGQSIIFFIMTAAWYLEKPTSRFRLWLLPILGAMALALLWSFARSAWIGVLVGLPVLIVLQQGRTRWFGVITSLTLTAGVLLVPPVREHFFRMFQMQEHVTRLNLWQSSWQGIKANPLLGFGPGNFTSLLDGFKVPGHYDTLAHSHNDLLMHGVNAGIPGMLAALGLLLVTCWILLQASRIESPYGWIFKGAVAVQVGITAAGFFQVFQTDDEVEILLYFILGSALALAQGVKQEESNF